MANLSQEQKQLIAEAANRYMVDKKLSAVKLSTQTGVNNGYLSLILRGVFSSVVNDKDTPIGDKHFLKLADGIGYKVYKTYWELDVDIPQFRQIINALVSGKEQGLPRMILASTGAGKTTSVDAFQKQNPLYTYKITVTGLHQLMDLLDDILVKMGLSIAGKKAQKLKRITEYVLDARRSGNRPMIIFDEAENLNGAEFRFMKALYDATGSHCSIVLIGTPDLLERLQKLVVKEKAGIPQMFRRFKAGITRIDPIDPRFKIFLDKYVKHDKGLRNLLIELCSNYGELRDFLEPAMREADEQGIELTEHFFRLKYDMPK